MFKYKFISLIFILISLFNFNCKSGIQTHDTIYSFSLAENNHSSFDIWIKKGMLPDGITILFFDAVLPDQVAVFTPFMSYTENTGKIFKLENVIIVDVLDCFVWNIPMTRILSHEFVHYRQLREMGYDKYYVMLNTNRQLIEDEAYNLQYENPVIAYIGEYKSIRDNNITELDLKL